MLFVSVAPEAKSIDIKILNDTLKIKKPSSHFVFCHLNLLTDMRKICIQNGRQSDIFQFTTKRSSPMNSASKNHCGGSGGLADKL